MRERVRFRRTREHPARALRRDLETVPQDPLDAVAGEYADLLRDLVRGAAVNAAAHARVFTLRVLAHAYHVDIGGAAAGQRRRQTCKQPHRPQIDVLIEPLADSED